MSSPPVGRRGLTSQADADVRWHDIPNLTKMSSLVVEFGPHLGGGEHGRVAQRDVGVPLTQLGAVVRGIADIAARQEVEIAVLAHAGDGNTHPLIVCDPMDPERTARAQVAYGEVLEPAIA